jgi:hypothetical protein
MPAQRRGVGEYHVGVREHIEPKRRRQKAVVKLQIDTDKLARIDADARHTGISREAWLQVAASRMLERHS